MLILAVDDLALGAGGTLAALGTGVAAAKVVWSYWTTKVDSLQVTHVEQLKEQDVRITDLQKELSRKSDEHAHKIEALQNVTLERMDRFGAKLGELLERTIMLQAETNHTLKAFQDRTAAGGQG